MIEDLDEINSLYEKIGYGLAAGAPAGWVSVWAVLEIIDVDVYDFEITYSDSEAHYHSLDPRLFRPYEVRTNLREVYRTMTRQGHSPWTSCRFEISNTGKVDVDFTYDQ